MDWAETTARQDENHLSFDIWCAVYYRFEGSLTECSLLLLVQREWCEQTTYCNMARCQVTVSLISDTYDRPDKNMEEQRIYQQNKIIWHKH